MLKYFKDDYTDGREPIDFGLIEEILKESVKISTGNTLPEESYKKIVLLFFAGINYYFYLHPEQYVDFGKFVAYRSIDQKNLWTLEAKIGENADSIYQYFKNGGLEIEDIKNMVKAYTFSKLEDSTVRLKKLSDSINEIEEIVRQDEEI